MAVEPYSAGRMGMQAVLGDTEARNFDRWAQSLTAAVKALVAGRNPVITEVGDEDIEVTQDHEVLVWSALTDHRTAHLPALEDTPEGKTYYFHRKITDSANTFRLVVDGNDGETIDGAGTYATALPSGSFGVMRGPTEWTIVDERLVDQAHRGVVENFDVDGLAQWTVRAAAGTGQALWRLTLGAKVFVGTVWTTNGFYFTEDGSTVFRVYNRSLLMGGGALDVAATDGFFYNVSWAGRPTGTPSPSTGRIANGFDSTNYRLDAHIGGAWESLPMRCLNVQTATVANAAVIGPSDLHSFALPAGVLARNGESIEVEYALTTAATVDTLIISVVFGSTTLFGVSAAAPTAGSLFIRARIYRTGATSQRVVTWMTADSASWNDQAHYTTAAETLANSLTIKITGEDSGPTGNLVSCHLSSVRFIPLGV